MASSSRKYESTHKKVVVVKSNEFFSLKKIDSQEKERIEDLKTSLTTPSNVSFISKVYDRASTSSLPPLAYTQTNTSSLPSLLKTQSYKYVVPSKQKTAPVPKRKYMRKVAVIENGLEITRLVDFANLSTTSNTANATHVKTTAEIEKINIGEDLNAEKVIEIVNNKYGDALEAQIPFFQQNKVTDHKITPLYIDTTQKTKILQDSPSKLLNNIYQKGLKEDERKKHLEKEEDKYKEDELDCLVLFPDSPGYDCQLFTREELKKFPDKIFASPVEPSVKQETPVKEENLNDANETNVYEQQKYSDIENIVHLENLKIKSEDDPNTLVSTTVDHLLMTVTLDSSRLNSKADELPAKKTDKEKIDSINITKQKVNDQNQIWKIEDKNADVSSGQSRYVQKNSKNILTSNENQIKMSINEEKCLNELVVADEDAIIFKEMDKFIEEMRSKNKILTSTDQNNEPSGNKTENKNNLDLNDCLELIEKDLMTPMLIQPRAVVSEMSLKIRDIEKLEIIPLIAKDKSVNAREVEGVLNASEDIPKSSKLKCETNTVILKKSAPSKHTIEIRVDKNKTNKDGDNLMLLNGSEDVENPVGTSDILQKPTLNEPVEGKYTDKTNGAEEALFSLNMLENNTSSFRENTAPLEIITNEKIVNSNDDNQIILHSFSEEFKTAPDSTTYEQHDSDECAILVVSKHGILEPLGLKSRDQNNESHISHDNDNVANLHSNQAEVPSKENRNSALEQSTLDEERKKIIKDTINKAEIITLLEKAKTYQYNVDNCFGDGGNIEKEKLKRFSTSLNEHIKIVKEIYVKLENFTESAKEGLENNLKNKDISTLYNNFSFIKAIMDKSFVKEEKKTLKYKVISITKKNTSPTKTNVPGKQSITKKIYKKKEVPKLPIKNPSNKLLQRTMFRVNKLLDILEKNQMWLLMNARQNTFVSKLKQVAKKDYRGTQMYRNLDSKNAETGLATQNISKCKISDCTKSNKNDQEEEILASSKNNEARSGTDINLENFGPQDKLNANEKSLAIVLKRSDNGSRADMIDINKKPVEEHFSQLESDLLSFENIDFNKDFVKVNQLISSFSTETVPSSIKAKVNEAGVNETDDNNKENQSIVQSKQDKENNEMKQQFSPRYSLRSRKTVNSGLNYSTSSYKDRAVSGNKKTLGYDVNYSNVIPLNKDDWTFDYVLRNDGKPCVVLYDKTKGPNKLVFENPNTQLRRQKRCTQNLKKDVQTKEHSFTNRYKTRSKTLKKRWVETAMILRSRKI